MCRALPRTCLRWRAVTASSDQKRMAGEHSPRLLHEVFASVLQRHAAAVAVDIPPGIGRAQRQTCSYAQLDRNAARVHAALGDDQGERVVCLLLARDTPWLYAAQLGVLRAGACYVGLEARNPDEHVRYVLHDAGAKVVLTDAQGCARLRGLVDHDVRLVDVATLPERAAPPPFAGEDARLAYVIYTSGTTGRPKGVMIEHCSVVNLVLGDVLEFGLTTADRVAQGSSPAYDSSVEETWMALSCGACVVPMDDEVVRRGPDLLPWLQDERITVLCPPPTLLRATGCLDPRAMLPELKLLYVGGEALPQELADRWAKGRRMVNGYGPTECTVTVTRSEVREGEPVTIGEAVPGNRALVVDESLHEVSPGDWGELCIVGKGVARGYLGRSDLTAERFMVVPPHGRMYRTGDRVRRSSSGALIYEGRLDAQVKLRGHRVELGEIEARLVAMDGVRAAACAVQDGEVLVAFIVPQDPSASMALDRLTAALRLELPAHMVPARMQAIAALPTTVGGKLDRRALPRLQIVGGVGSRDGRDSVGALEHLVAAAFCKALACTRVPADVDFFDLGGDSLRAAVMISHLRDDARTEALAVRDVYETRTVEALALRAERAGAAVAGERVRPEPEGVHEVLVTGVQTLWLAGELIATASLAYGLVFLLTPFVIDAIGVVPFVFSSLWIFAALRLLLAVPLLVPGVQSQQNWIAGLLLGTYNVLILDEPGNHLDVETVESLAEALLAYKGTVIFTSHDRHFVRRIATNIIEVRDGQVRNYAGKYDDYIYYVNKEIEDGERERASGRLATPPAGKGAGSKVDKPAAAKDIHTQRKTLRNLEKAIAKLDEQKKAFNAEMMKTSDAKKAMELHTQLEAVTKELADVEEKWCELQQELGEW